MDLPRLEEDLPYFYGSHVFMCVNVRPAGHPRGCCTEKGSLELRAYMKNRAKEAGLTDVRINASQCLDRCERGPAGYQHVLRRVWHPSYDLPSG